jgi:hypothetical protein
MCEGPIPIPWDARLDRVATDIVVWLPCAASGWASMGGGGGQDNDDDGGATQGCKPWRH